MQRAVLPRYDTIWQTAYVYSRIPRTGSKLYILCSIWASTSLISVDSAHNQFKYFGWHLKGFILHYEAQED
jgi:hypothetical protein